MEFLSLSILFGIIVISDEILNGQLKLSERLFNWLEENINSREKPDSNDDSNHNVFSDH